MSPPKNKAFLISQLKDKYPEEELVKLTVLQLTKMKKQISATTKEPVGDDEDEPSLVQRLGCS